MKICKVEIIKRVNGVNCQYIYPLDYNPYKTTIIAYEDLPLEEGDNASHCIGTVENNFIFTDKMIEINKDEASNFIDKAADNIADKDNKAKCIRARKKMLERLGG